MTEYEVIREIPNQCSNNQMRDIFFDEIECESPLDYVRAQFPDKVVEITAEPETDGRTVIYAVVNGLTNKYIFTKI